MNTSQKTTGPHALQPTREAFDDRATLELRRWLEAIERAQSPASPAPARPDAASS
jgi:hypothetical protein